MSAANKSLKCTLGLKSDFLRHTTWKRHNYALLFNILDSEFDRF